MTTGQQIAALRRAAGLSQEALADRLGVTRQAVSKWEADTTLPTTDNLAELAKLFGVPADRLLRPNEENGADAPSPAPPQKQKPLKNLPVILLSGAVLLLAVWNFNLQREIDRLENRVNSLPAGGSQVIYLPEQTTDKEIMDVGFTDESYDPAADTIDFTAHVTLARWNEGDSARFLVRQENVTLSESETLSLAENCTARLTIPRQAGLALYLQITDAAGSSRLERLCDLDKLAGRYTLQVGFDVMESRLTTTNNSFSGQLALAVQYFDDTGANEAPAVTGAVTILRDGEVAVTQQLTGADLEVFDWPVQPAVAEMELTGYALFRLPFKLEWQEDTEQVTARYSLTDAHGRVYSGEQIFWQKGVDPVGSSGWFTGSAQLSEWK